MRAPLVASAALLSLTTALLAAPAQEISVAPAIPQQFSRPVVADGNANCPVGFTARRQSPTEVVAVSRAARHTSGQGVHISFVPSCAEIRSAEVTVHAVSSRTRYLPLGGWETNADLSRNFRLSDSGSSGLRVSDLWLDRAGSILSVDLLSITYADGTTWQRNRRSSCHAPINGFLLIDGHAAGSAP